jgi:hypothetical protein
MRSTCESSVMRLVQLKVPMSEQGAGHIRWVLQVLGVGHGFVTNSQSREFRVPLQTAYHKSGTTTLGTNSH